MLSIQYVNELMFLSTQLDIIQFKPFLSGCKSNTYFDYNKLFAKTFFLNYFNEPSLKFESAKLILILNLNKPINAFFLKH